MKVHALAAAFAFVGVCSASAAPGDAVRPVDDERGPGYAVASWSTADGQSIGPVRALAQDRSGYLWVGTDGGLLRFDGFDFTSANAILDRPLPNVPVRALYFSASDQLWVGMAEGGGIYRIKDGRLDGGAVTSVAGNVNAFAEEPGTRTIWVGHDGGLLRSRPDRWEIVPRTTGLPAGGILHVRVETDSLLIGSTSGFFRGPLQGDHFEKVSLSGDTTVRDTARDGAGRTWLTDSRSGYRGVDRPVSATRGGRGTRWLQDGHGRLWLGTLGQGVWRIDESTGEVVERITMREGLLNDGIGALLEDREQNLWVGTFEGLNRLTAHSVTPLLGLTLTSSIARGPDGVMWAASVDGVAAFTLVNGTPTRTLHRMQGARTLYPDGAGRVWVATDDGLVRLEHGTRHPVVSPEGTPFSRVTAITGDANGTVWFADASKGLWSWAGGVLRTVALPSGYQGVRETALLARPDGLWIVFERGRLGRLTPEGGFRAFGTADGLPHDTITAIHDGPRTGLWLTGSHGLSHFANDQFVTFDRRHGLPARRATAVVEDQDGGLWLALASVGIAHLGPDEVTRALAKPGELHTQVVDPSDGLAGMPTSLDSRTSTRDDAGHLWFVTGRGLTMIDPAKAFARPRTSGPARIEAAFADDRRFEPGVGLALPAGINRLRIVYTAVSLSTAEHTRFRYRLEGFDQEWHDAGTSRQAVYTNLPPRQYRFLLQSAANDGVVTTTSADWTFAIAPHLYQTWSFYLFSATAIGLVATGAWRLRLRQVRREYEIVLAERARVGRELHDTLLQTMAGVALHVDDVAKNLLPRAPDAERQLVAVRQTIEDGIVEARQVIWQMRSANEPGDLVAALEAMAAQITAGTPVRFKLSVAGAPRTVDVDVRSGLLRIAQEAVSNAVRHGRPTSVSIELCFGAGSLALRVSDNGDGFDAPTRAATHHFGLITMEERTQQLGGRFRLTTAIGAGTQVEAVVPL